MTMRYSREHLNANKWDQLAPRSSWSSLINVNVSVIIDDEGTIRLVEAPATELARASVTLARIHAVPRRHPS